MASGRDENPKARPFPAEPVRDQDYVTSDELFGEMVDAPMPTPSGPALAPPARSGPIKVQVNDPRASPGAARLEGAHQSADESEVNALLARIEPLLETPAPGGKPPSRVEPTPGGKPPSRVEPMPGGKPPSRVEPTPGGESPSEAEPGFGPESAFNAPPVVAEEPEFDEELPAVAARTATKFQAAAPKPPAAAESGGLDLALLAEDALAEAGASRRSPGKEGSWRDDTYGPYRLLDRIAVGGMAEVFKAKRSGVEGFEKIVAMKRILPHLSDNKEFVDMFVDEAKMVAGLTHPNIVQIFDLGRIDTSYYIAMEYVHGRDLRTILKRAREKGVPMPQDLCLRIVSLVSSALEYAHRKKDDRGRAMQIVHRDVSPQNILISFEGEVKLTDFGIAKAATKASNTDRGALRGKLLYMSPEQAWGRAMDRRSDLFSLGIVLYEMITGQKPFLGGGTEMSILEMVRQCHIEPPRQLNPRIGESLNAVVTRALGREPDDRYQDAGEMHQALEKVLRERPPPTVADLARFMEKLFDRHEREEAFPEDHPSGEHKSGSGEHRAGTSVLEDEVEALPDPMSVDTLLRRFGIK
jgi:serine/threonine protein kinase